jgi:hypothetical protein
VLPRSQEAWRKTFLKRNGACESQRMMRTPGTNI